MTTETRPAAPDEVAAPTTGPLWRDAHAVTWPRAAMPGPYRCGCNSSYGQSCPACDGSLIR